MKIVEEILHAIIAAIVALFSIALVEPIIAIFILMGFEIASAYILLPRKPRVIADAHVEENSPLMLEYQEKRGTFWSKRTRRMIMFCFVVPSAIVFANGFNADEVAHATYFAAGFYLFIQTLKNAAISDELFEFVSEHIHRHRNERNPREPGQPVT